MPRTNKVGRAAIWILAGVLSIETSLSNISFAAAQSPLRQTFGLDFSPYLSGQDPHSHFPISTRQIFDRLLIVSPYTHWVRTYGSTQGLENTPAIARQLGFKVAAGAWISGDMVRNEREIANLISAANAGDVDVAIVGSEAILRGDVSTSQLIVYMDRVRQATHATVPVTTADEWGIFIAHPDLIEASDIVLAHFFPYWESMSIADATCSLAAAYRTLSVAAGPRSVWIGEAGWPTDGDAQGLAIPSIENASQFALEFLTWANAAGIPSFYFSAFDEAWKADDEGPQGAHWGLFDANAAMKPEMGAYFDGQTASVTCDEKSPNSGSGSMTDAAIARRADLGNNARAVSSPRITGAMSRKVHGAAGTFDLMLSLAPEMPTIEPRQGPAQTIVVVFDKPIAEGDAAVIEGTATVGSATFIGNQMIVQLSDVIGEQYVTLSLANVTAVDGGNGGNASVRVGFLLGDAKQQGIVTTSHVDQMNAQIAQWVTGINYLNDVNASGTLTVADKAITRSQIAKALPMP